MPNWCDNKLTLTGDKGSIQKIVDAKLSFMALVPPPEGEWDYGWCCQNWGTKWEPEFNGLELIDSGDGDGLLKVTFSSAWSPPVEAIATICAEHNLQGRLEYFEGGVGFLGVAEFIGQWHVDNTESFHSLDGLEALAKCMGNEIALVNLESMRDTQADIDEPIESDGW